MYLDHSCLKSHMRVASIGEQLTDVMATLSMSEPQIKLRLTGNEATFNLGTRPHLTWERGHICPGNKAIPGLGTRPQYRLGMRPQYRLGTRPQYRLGTRPQYRLGTRPYLTWERDHTCPSAMSLMRVCSFALQKLPLLLLLLFCEKGRGRAQQGAI